MGKKVKDPYVESEDERTLAFDFEFHAKIADFKEEPGSGDGETRRVIEGYASTEDKDRGNEVTHKEAFKSSLKKFLKDNPLLTYMHNWDQPIGIIEEARVDEKGLWVKAVLAVDDPVADRVWNLIKQKVLRAFSFGYRILKVEHESEDDGKEGPGTRHLKDLELLEVAVVSIPMNRNTYFSVSKALKYGTDSINLDPIESAGDSDDDIDTKAGRVLSRKNRTAITAALEALQVVLELADKPKVDDDDDEEEEEKKLAKEETKVKEEVIVPEEKKSDVTPLMVDLLKSITGMVADEAELQEVAVDMIAPLTKEGEN